MASESTPAAVKQAPANSSAAATQRERDLFERLLANTQVGVSVWELVDPNEPGSLTVFYANDAMVNIAGWDFRTVLGRRMDDWAPSLVTRGRAAQVAEVCQSGQAKLLDLVHYEADQLVKGMPEGWFESRAVPLGPNVVGIMSENVTARVLAEQQLAASRAALERSNTELERFAYVASHDLQEPLRKVQAFGDRLSAHLGPQLDERGRDYLDRMQNAAGRMRDLIDGLLSFSRVRIRQGERMPVQLGEIVAGVLSDLESRIEESGAEIHVQELETVFGSPLQLRQLVQNLLANAIKFQPPGQKPVVHIGCTAAVLSGGVPGVELTFRDNGIGFDAQYAERIFEPFQRLQGRFAYPGSGMGLAVCRRIVEQHGGRLHAESAPGEGATFRLWLPSISKEQ